MPRGVRPCSGGGGLTKAAFDLYGSEQIEMQTNEMKRGGRRPRWRLLAAAMGIGLAFGAAGRYLLSPVGPAPQTANNAVISDRGSAPDQRLEWIERALQPASTGHAAVAEQLLQLAQDPREDRAVRIRALHSIGAADPEQRLGPAILNLLARATDPGLQYAAAYALRFYRLPAAIPILQDCFAHGDYLMRITAAHSLAAQADPDAAAWMLQALRQCRAQRPETGRHNELVAMHLALALGEAQQTAVLPELRQMLSDPVATPDMRKAAAEAIGRLRTPAGAMALADAMASECDEAVLVYIGRAMLTADFQPGAAACRRRAELVQDEYVRTSLLDTAARLERDSS